MNLLFAIFVLLVAASGVFGQRAASTTAASTTATANSATSASAATAPAVSVAVPPPIPPELSTPIATIAPASSGLSDARPDFRAVLFVGATVDSFLAKDLGALLNPAESGRSKTGSVAGVDFEYRAMGGGQSTKGWAPQLWVYGRTMHGIRSVEVDCSQAIQADLCAAAAAPGSTAATAGSQFVWILRNASSVEAFAGLRLEFLTLRAHGDAGKLYAKTELGFLSIAGAGGDVADSHQKLALGAVLTNGHFQGSLFEIGAGRSDVFRVHPGRRVKVRGMLTWASGVLAEKGVRPFLEMTVDSDFGSGADSVRTTYGLSLDVDRMLGR